VIGRLLGFSLLGFILRPPSELLIRLIVGI
jgi:hypothetical protein